MIANELGPFSLTGRTLGYCGGVRGTEVQLFDGGSGSGGKGEGVQSERWEWIPLANAA